MLLPRERFKMHNCSKFTANMDDYLLRLGFCRKTIVRDSSCLFRIVSEQVYFTQTYHTVVQKKCLEYLCSHRDEFLTEIPIHCEMMALSKLYKYDIIIFQSPDDMPVNVTKNGFEKTVLLCHVDGIHYDIVYQQSYIDGLSVCQSIIYEVLYKGVFKLKHELEEAVTFLRHQKKSSRESSTTESDHGTQNPSNSPPDNASFDLSQKIALKLTPPLPYRIAKALDPTIYRNVARDIVEEEKREAKLRYQNFGFSPGDKCQVVLSSQPNKAYNAFIQELTDNQGPVVVFVEDLGEKRTVPYSSLRHFPASRNGCQYSYSDTGYVSYIDKKCKRKKAGMPIPSDINTYHSTRRPAPRNWLQTSVKNMQLPSQPVDYTTNIDVSSPYCSVAMNGPNIMSSSPSLPVPNPTTYYMPVINVPYPPNIGHVNFNIGPSQDPYGKDLPQDVNTLRYFYNFGVENASVGSFNRTMNTTSCRMMSTVMPPPTTISYAPAVVPAESQCHMIMSAPIEHGQSRTSDKTNACCTQNQTNHPKNVTVSVKDNSVNSDRDVDSESKDIETDNVSNSDNSGLASPDKLDSLGSDSGLDSTTSGAEEPLTYTIDSQDTGKVVKGKRKYYMYGNLKLVKPIKEIPPRFQMLLAETSAAKARCEGQPIYIQTHSENITYEQETELNANARCFVPMQSCMPPSMNCTNVNVNNNLNGVGANNNIQHNITPIPNACFPPPPAPYVMGGAQSAMVHGPPPPTPQVTNYSKVQVSSQTLAEPPASNNVGASNYINSNGSGGGATCYYVYSSTSSGYSTLPPTTPAPPGNGQGQVIYVMNSPYTAPPLQTYQPMPPVPPYVTCSAAAQ